MDPGDLDVPPHINDAIVAMSRLPAEQSRQAHPVQRRIARTFGAVAQPKSLIFVTALLGCWVGLNLGLMALGRRSPDPPPFTYLAGAASLASFYLAAIIVITQRHDDEMAAHRDQLTLQLAILADQKSAKLIRLLGEWRRNDPAQSNDHDAEAEAMATPVDPRAVLAGIKASQSALSVE